MSEEGGERGRRQRGGAGLQWEMHSVFTVHFRHGETNPKMQIQQRMTAAGSHCAAVRQHYCIITH